MTPYSFGRPAEQKRELPSFLDEANRLGAFVPPFRFTSFFSPEDTLLCACASEAALVRARPMRPHNASPRETLKIAELTTGSGLVGLHLLRLETGSTLLGIDVDQTAVKTAGDNAALLGFSDRATFESSDLWSRDTVSLLTDYSPHLLICNPPYVPEPPNGKLALEAGAGPDGTAHLMRTLEIAGRVSPRALALSWCSLSDPGAVIEAAETRGYTLNSLLVVAIADGEYSGSVHEYLKSLPNTYLNESEETVRIVASDGAARFSYLLMAGDFSRSTAEQNGAADAVRQICRDFSSHGLSALTRPAAPILVRTWLLDRWDEVRLRAFLHGGTVTDDHSAA